MNEQLKAVSENSDAKSARISELEQTLEQIKSENTDLQNQIAEYTGANGESQKVDVLLQAASDYLNAPDDSSQVADVLYNVDTDYVEESASDAYRQLYYQLMAAIGEDTADELYDAGKASINQSDYTTAISQLEKAWYFSKHMEEPNPDILYELGQAYMLAGENDKANSTYHQVMREYPDSSAATKAAERTEDEGDTATE